MHEPSQPDPHEIASGLHAAADRLTELLEHALERSSLGTDDARLVFQEFSVGMEELRVAEEELAVQAEQLAASQQAIDAERERYAQLFEAAPDAYLETDDLGKIIEVNAAGEEMLGVRRIMLVGKLLHSFIDNDDRRAVRHLLNTLLLGSERERIQVRVTPRKGPVAIVELSASAHYDPSDGRQRVRWLLRDIGDRLKLENDLRQAHGEVELLDALGSLTTFVAAAHDGLDVLLARLVELAKHLAHGCEAGIMLVGPRGDVVRHSVSGPVAQRLCDLQIERGGPGIEAMRSGDSAVHAADELAAWPALAAAAAELHVGYVASQPLRSDDRVIGVVNLYTGALVEGLEASLALLAAHGGALISTTELYARTAQLAEQLTTALESRGVIEQAKGILMAREHCSADEAFDMIRRASQRENRKLRLIAEDIVARASAPTKPRL
jgi:PAS domain S-box-containing protein